MDATLGCAAADAPARRALAGAIDHDRALANLLLVAIYRHGPIDRAGLLELMPVDETALERALTSLEQHGRVEREGSGAQARFRCERVVIAFHDPEGWEAAVYDHYQAMVTALCRKLAHGLSHAEPDESLGGSTYSFDLWDGHPLAHEARSLLPSLRRAAQSLRARVEAYNERHPVPEHVTPFRVVAYVGQTVIGEEGNDHV
jgi:DNA-binding MarR family transcriptional regulator